MKILEFLAGTVVGLLLSGIAFWAILGFFEPDPLQKQASTKAYCNAVKEHLSLIQTPEERLEFLKKHEKSLAKCDD